MKPIQLPEVENDEEIIFSRLGPCEDIRVRIDKWLWRIEVERDEWRDEIEDWTGHKVDAETVQDELRPYLFPALGSLFTFDQLTGLNEHVTL